MPSAPSSRRSLLHCFAMGSFALGSKLFSGLAVQTLGICLLGAVLRNCFLVGLAHLSHRRGLTRWRLCKGRSQTHHKRQECCASKGEPFQHDRHPPFADNPNPDPKVMISFCLRTGAASIRASPFQLFVTFTVIATALLDPFQAAIRIGGFIGVVLVEAGVHASFAGGFVRVLRRHGGREDRVPRSSRRRRRRSGGCRRSCCNRSGCRIGPALSFAKIIPALPVEGARGFCRLVLGAALLHGWRFSRWRKEDKQSSSKRSNRDGSRTD